MFNQYGIILINPDINNKLNIEDARKYINWILTKDAKKLINKFKKHGKQIFFYNYN